MPFNRRQFIQTGFLAGFSMLPAITQAEHYFESIRKYATNCGSNNGKIISLQQNIRDYLKTFFGTDRVYCDKRLLLVAPLVYDKPTRAPVSVLGDMKNITDLVLFSSTSKDPLVAKIQFGKAMSLPIATNVNLELRTRTPTIIVIVRSGNKLFGVQRNIKISCGDC